MKPATIEKINGLGKAAYIIASIAKVLTVIGIVGVVIGMIVCFAIPGDLFQANFSGSASIDIHLDTLGIDLADADRAELEAALEEGEADGTLTVNSMEFLFSGIRTEGNRVIVDAVGGGTLFSVKSLRVILICALLALIATLVCMIFVCKFSKSLQNCTTPFDPKLVRRMKQLAWAMLSLPVINSLTESMSSLATSGDITIGLSVELSQVILILALFALSYIFQYGAQLQRESDETL